MDPTPGRHNSLVTQSQAKTRVAHRHNASKAPSAQAESVILFKEDSSCRVIFICISLPAFSGVKNTPRQQHFLALCFGQNVVGRFLKIPGESQGKGGSEKAGIAGVRSLLRDAEPSASATHTAPAVLGLK